MKQTAIEWLFQKLWDTPKDKLTWYSILNEAKAMHKEEIVKSFMNVSDDRDYRLQDVHLKEFAEQYYKENFGGNK